LDVDVPHSNRQSEMADELKEATQHSSQISPVFGDIAAKMELAAKREIQRLLALGQPIIIDRGNGIEEWYSWPPSD
jgi:2-keto-4-pentenoate hydratase